MVAGARILVIRLGSLGDVVFTLPAVHALRAAYPECRLTFLTYREFAPLLAGFGDIEAVWSINRAGYKALNPKVLLGDTTLLFSRLLCSRFSLAVDLQGFGETGWMTWWSGAPQRWGSVYRPHRSWAYTHPIARNPALHPVDQNLEVLRQAGKIQRTKDRQVFVVPETALHQARQWFAANNIELNRPTLLLHPLTSTPHKNWPLPHYIEMARWAVQSGLQVLFGGGPADRAALEPAREAGFAVAAGTPLPVSAGLARLSTLVVGGDSGLPHLAAAMGKRVVMIMGSLKPGSCHPFGHKNWAVMPASGSPISSVPLRTVCQMCTEALGELGISARTPRLRAAETIAC